MPKEKRAAQSTAASEDQDTTQHSQDCSAVFKQLETQSQCDPFQTARASMHVCATPWKCPSFFSMEPEVISEGRMAHQNGNKDSLHEHFCEERQKMKLG